jgi:hypothetical protein
VFSIEHSDTDSDSDADTDANTDTKTQDSSSNRHSSGHTNATTDTHTYQKKNHRILYEGYTCNRRHTHARFCMHGWDLAVEVASAVGNVPLRVVRLQCV